VQESWQQRGTLRARHDAELACRMVVSCCGFKAVILQCDACFCRSMVSCRWRHVSRRPSLPWTASWTRYKRFAIAAARLAAEPPQHPANKQLVLSQHMAPCSDHAASA
jgi:hypothetical protein